MKPTCLVVLSVSLLALEVNAATITFQQGGTPSAAYTHVAFDIRGSGAINNSADLTIGNQPGGVLQIRGLVGFSLSQIPAGSVIDSVTLTLTVNSGAGNISNLGTLDLREIIPAGNPANNITEGGSTWTNWNNAASSPWTTLGGDYSGVLTTAAVIDGNTDNLFTAGEKATFASTASLVAAAQAALNAGLPLELAIISPAAEAGSSSTLVRFGSNTVTDISYRPLLTINYTVPEPSSAALLALGGLSLAFQRRRK